MTIRLHDSVSRQTREFVPREPGRVGIYVCGLTVQSAPHVGHVRSGVAFDLLRRWLVHRGLEVTFIRNVTDIDDKILVTSAEQGRPWWDLAYAMRRELDRAYDALHVLPPSYEPLATGHVPEMIELIERLVVRGHAYVAEDGSGDVYFDVRSWPSYGELSGQRVEEMEPSHDTADASAARKRDPRDFALWKGWKKESEPESAAWPAPWGPGRPGWHIECSAMALKYLGGEFDIHAGGVDLRFPHHENEQAQSRAAGYGFATTWLHNAWITTAGEKMSKSLGNSLTVPAVLQRSRAIDLRYYLVSSHYRSHVEFSFDALDEAAAAFARVEGFLERAGGAGVPVGSVPEGFAAAMDDDLGAPAAVAVLHDAVREGNRALAAGDEATVRRTAGEVRGMLGVLGLDPYDDHWASGGDDTLLRGAVDALVGALLEQRQAARAARDFATADVIRDRLTVAGIDVEDGPAGSTWSLR